MGGQRPSPQTCVHPAHTRAPEPRRIHTAWLGLGPAGCRGQHRSADTTNPLLLSLFQLQELGQFKGFNKSVENLFLSVTTHMKSKWMPLPVSFPAPPGPAEPTDQGCDRAPLSASAFWEAAAPGPPPLHPQGRPLVPGGGRHPAVCRAGSVFSHSCPNLPQPTHGGKELAPGTGAHPASPKDQDENREIHFQ